ncbi:dynamin family protein [Polaribacter litorisediminis]|uniref:dynamin family protein n=1 Tax=Polaribacter litorisediminis TaxID=1908341 RepID=UPI001CBBE7AB|nr:dynamin family protein [Polaribacter litorisediminis]UAM96696.1 dynamin family protein [Polaribacter litorisediminis]
MKSIKEYSVHFESIIKETVKQVTESNLLTDEIINKGNQHAQQLLESIHQNFTIKVPIVGDFSTGKSSLLNALMSKEILPTGIRPETAVSYELYYAPIEVAELYRNGSEISNCKLESIKGLDVKPGDIVKVYVDNLKIKTLYNEGITLVDMPGSDSGVEAHQKAILSYLKEGSAFITLVDIEQGSIKGSNLKFMQEILSYNLSSAVLVTKCDKKTVTEQDKIKNFIIEQVKRYDKSNSSVGMVSAMDSNIGDFEKVISDLDSASLFYDRFQPLVSAFMNQWQEWLQLEANVISKNKEELQLKLANLKESAERAKEEISSQKTSPELGMFAVDEILQKVKDALKNKANTIGSYILQNDQEGANREISDTARPILINSLEGIQSKLSHQISINFEDINQKLKEFVSTSDKTLNVVDTIGTTMSSIKDKISNTNNLNKYRGITAMIGVTTSFIAPWLEVIIIFAPDILNALFGKKDEQDKLTQAVNGFVDTSIPQIINKLRPEVEKGIEEQRQIILKNIEEGLAQKVKEVDERITLEYQKIATNEEEKNEKLVAINLLQQNLRELALFDIKSVNSEYVSS